MTELRWGLDWELDGGEVAWRVGSDPGRWVLSTMESLVTDFSAAWERHRTRVDACRGVCERTTGLARAAGVDLSGLPVVVDAWGGSCELEVRPPSGRRVTVSVPGEDGPVAARSGWGRWVEGLDDAAAVDLVRGAS
ncbi:hypothetical protein [Actinomyces sp.]|uniref:hypothetical protein n=1 Tax=Actinomyces sp. TaxID=29317 RepID=UPI0026DAE49A|nr:hypothetical protein [Actinomyces sp.]MDO4899437.1 hypothetical protein [Actinomyces sp.]